MELWMDEDSAPQTQIKIVGVGGAGGNAINRLVGTDLPHAEYIIMNTDRQVLQESPCRNTVQLGEKLTGGRGAGGDPEIGRRSAEECRDEIAAALRGAQMVFLAAGMGGGTGTGALPVIAKTARELGAVTVAIVTKPFAFERGRKMRLAQEGIDATLQHIDALVVVPNERLKETVKGGLTLANAFAAADDVLIQGVVSLALLICTPGFINVDFEDIKRTLRQAGPAHIGVGIATGSGRARAAAEAALHNPLLEAGVHGARRVLFHVTVPPDVPFGEVEEAAMVINEAVHEDAQIIWGTSFEDGGQGAMKIILLAADLDQQAGREQFVFSSAPPAERENMAPPPAEVGVGGYELQLDELMDMVNQRRDAMAYGGEEPRTAESWTPDDADVDEDPNWLGDIRRLLGG